MNDLGGPSVRVIVCIMSNVWPFPPVFVGMMWKSGLLHSLTDRLAFGLVTSILRLTKVPSWFSCRSSSIISRGFSMTVSMSLRRPAFSNQEIPSVMQKTVVLSGVKIINSERDRRVEKSHSRKSASASLPR